MRKNLSRVFFGLAFVLISLQLISTFMELTDVHVQNRLLHTVTNREKAVVIVDAKKTVDFKKIAQEMSQEKY